MVQRPFRQHRALMQHGDAAGQRADEIHVMFDHDDGMIARKVAQQLGGAHGLGIGHAGGGLIDQQKPWFLRQIADLVREEGHLRVRGLPLPAHIAAQGITADMLSPGRAGLR